MLAHYPGFSLGTADLYTLEIFRKFHRPFLSPSLGSPILPRFRGGSRLRGGPWPKGEPRSSSVPEHLSPWRAESTWMCRQVRGLLSAWWLGVLGSPSRIILLLHFVIYVWVMLPGTSLVHGGRGPCIKQTHRLYIVTMLGMAESGRGVVFLMYYQINSLLALFWGDSFFLFIAQHESLNRRESNLVLFWCCICLWRGVNPLRSESPPLSPQPLLLSPRVLHSRCIFPRASWALLGQCQACPTCLAVVSSGGLPGPIGSSCVVDRILIVSPYLVVSLDQCSYSGFTLHPAKMARGFIRDTSGWQGQKEENQTMLFPYPE